MIPFQGCVQYKIYHILHNLFNNIWSDFIFKIRFRIVSDLSSSNMEWIKTRNETYGEISVVNRQGNPSFAPLCPLDTQAIQALTVFRDNCRAQCNNCIIPATLTTWGEVGRVTSGWTARSWKGVATEL